MSTPPPIQISIHPAWVAVAVHGSLPLGTLLGLIDANAARLGTRSLLIDARAARGLDGTAHAILGEHLALKLAATPRIAIVASEDAITYNSERVAARRGVRLLVFSDRCEAERWLAAGDGL